MKKNESTAVTITEVRIIEIADGEGNNKQRWIEITTDVGLNGYAGPLDGIYQFKAINDRLHVFNDQLVNRDIFDENLEFANLWHSIYPNHPLNDYANGKDPLTGQDVWKGHRTSRHSSTGEVITGFSAIDIAVWDLRGKAKNMPVHKLLGGTRLTLPTYVSCMGNKNPEQALEKATYWYDKGFKMHKCFLPHRPNGQSQALKKNLDIVHTLRNQLPDDAEIMYDLSRLSEQVNDPATRTERLQWVCDLVEEMLPYDPYWIEEPVAPDDIYGYEAIKKAHPAAKLSTGEHLYTRWNIKPFLERGLLDYVQCDPEWCGGISEYIEICKMIQKSYPEVRVVPHGHMILAASQGVASQSEKVSPLVEYLYQPIPERIRYLKQPIEPESGILTMPYDSGVGPDLDPTKYQITHVYSII